MWCSGTAGVNRKINFKGFTCTHYCVPLWVLMCHIWIQYICWSNALSSMLGSKCYQCTCIIWFSTQEKMISTIWWNMSVMVILSPQHHYLFYTVYLYRTYSLCHSPDLVCKENVSVNKHFCGICYVRHCHTRSNH